MKWQQEEAAEGGDELSRASPPSMETTVTPLSRMPSADEASPSPSLPLGFLARNGKRRMEGTRIPKPTTDPIMRIRIARVDRILVRFDLKLTKSQDK